MCLYRLAAGTAGARVGHQPQVGLLALSHRHPRRFGAKRSRPRLQNVAQSKVKVYVDFSIKRDFNNLKLHQDSASK